MYLTGFVKGGPRCRMNRGNIFYYRTMDTQKYEAADSPHNRAGDTTGEQAGRRRGIAPDSEANRDKVAAQGAPSLALGMVTLEVPKVSQVRRTRDGSGNRAGTNTDRMDKRDTNKKKKKLANDN